MEKAKITYDDFARVDVRIGRVLAVHPFERARHPAYKVEVDFGDFGTKRSSAQITSYLPEELVGKPCDLRDEHASPQYRGLSIGGPNHRCTQWRG